MSHIAYNSFPMEFEGLNVKDAQANASNWNYECHLQPRLKCTGVMATDITKQFISAAQLLDPGQIIQDPAFSLFDSVSALEIMDRKMDTGFLEPGETMDDNYDFSQDLLPGETIGIMDQLICHEMAWHMGHPLAQTIFTSLHIDHILRLSPLGINDTYFNPNQPDEPLMHRALRAYCLGLLKTCNYINNRIISENFYEEEDFVTNTFNRDLLENFELASIVELIDGTIKLIASHEGESNYRDAITSRLHFRALFLKAVENADSRTLTCKSTNWSNLKSLITELKQSAAFGVAAPTAFSEKLQKKLASSIPPRPIIHLNWEDALIFLERMCLDAFKLVDVLNYSDCHSLLTFIIRFQARKPQPSIYVRALLQHYIFTDSIILGSISMRQIIDENLTTTVLPDHVLLDPINDEIEVPTDPRHLIATWMELFRSRAAGSYLDMLRTLCQNRCRIRRTLCHTIVSWDKLHLDAEEVEKELQVFLVGGLNRESWVSSSPVWSFPLSSWVTNYKICQMEWIIQLGFELEIYQPSELAGMYWYLNYLARYRSQNLERIQSFVTHNYQAAHKNTAKTLEDQSKYLHSLMLVDFLNLNVAATIVLAQALSYLFTALKRLSLLESSKQPLSDDQLRYETRMKPFHSVKLPKLVPFDKFTQTVTRPEETTLNLLHLAAQSARKANKKFEALTKLTPRESFSHGSHESWLEDIKNSLRASIFTNISISTLTKAIESSENGVPIKLKAEIPRSESSYHHWWIVPNILPSN